ncbi:hypothetical protein GCM10009733_072380 [Nonomuraea maheshkhaliensis]|uniref:Uncharacterized protein n=1 Tax=Nonomuraea maheshkhaliensis TaxID=419590 RepID=A0ABN2G3C6_9ACTN
MAPFNRFATSNTGRRLLDAYLRDIYQDIDDWLPIPAAAGTDYRGSLERHLADLDFPRTLAAYLDETGDEETVSAMEDLHHRIRETFEPVASYPIPITALTELEDHIRRSIQRADDATAMVSVVFAHPRSIVFRDLRNNFAYINVRSGEAWDVYFAGYVKVPLINRWRFDAESFNETRKAIESLHQKALRSIHSPAQYARSWNFSGTADIVSFMAYLQDDIHLDWLSLHACRLLDADGRYLRYSLGEIVESLSDWRKEDDAVMREFAPGEMNREVASALSLKSVLTATAQQFPGGIAVNAAYDLLKKVLGG